MNELISAFIGGEPVQTTHTFEVIDPSTGEVTRHASRCGTSEVDQAVRSARRAFERGWKRSLPRDRADVMRRLADLLRNERDSLARTETEDTGKPLKQAYADADLSARYFEFYADCIEALYGHTIPGSSDLLMYTLREPHGVTGHIVPWNYPLQIAARTVAPSLACGNCCVLKPAEESPSTARRLGQLALDAGFPEGALNVVPGLGEEAGAALAAHPGINHLSFTGSVEVGRSVAMAAGQNTIPVTLELGGKSPNIVFADARVEEALPVVVNSIIQNAGQTCSAGSRLLVEKSIHEAIVDELAERFKSVQIGPGLEDPDLGPLISARQLERVKSYVDLGRRDAHLVTGGGVPKDKNLSRGFFFSPTLFDQVPPEAAIGQDEIFGPVLSVTTFDGVEEATRLANATRYGLVAAVWTQDIGKAHWLAKEIEAGQIFVNTYGAGGTVEVPFGGYKHSGFGREKGFEALLGYTQTKAVVVRMAGSFRNSVE